MRRRCGRKRFRPIRILFQVAAADSALPLAGGQRDDTVDQLSRDDRPAGREFLVPFPLRNPPTPGIVLGERHVEVPMAVGLLADAGRRHEFGISRNRKSPLAPHPRPIREKLLPSARARHVRFTPCLARPCCASEGECSIQRMSNLPVELMASISQFRTTVTPGDAAAVEAIVRSAVVFSEEEIAIARELVEDNLTRGSIASGYHFLFSD